VKSQSSGELRHTLMRTRSALIATGVLSAALNVLLLGGSIYMMLIYDSVLPSQSIPTLVGLLLMVVVVYFFQGLFDVFRSRILAAVGATFDARIAARVQRAAFDAVLRNPSQSSAAHISVRDLDNIRGFLGSPGPAAFMDLPWIIFFVLVLAMLHVWLALTALLGALVMIGLTFLAHRQSKEPTESVARRAIERNALAEERWRHAELIQATGMQERNLERWLHVNYSHLGAQDSLSRTTGTLSGVSRVFRMLLQSLVLTVGAMLVIGGQATGGVIFASSIIAARALAPIDQVIGHWKGFEAARGSWKRLSTLLERVPSPPEVHTVLPPPRQYLAVEELAVVPPGSQRITAQVPGFRLQAGDALGVIGPSGSGKSSLVRALVGAWRPARGSIRLDGAALDQYAPELLGNHLGYLPQNVELMSGTVGENISRFAAEHDSEKIVAAAISAGVHDLIVSLPQGYDTPVGSDGGQLSGGQRQRIGLARALYGEPFLVVLDEPNSNLDAEGEVALDESIARVRERGGIVIVIAHRASALNRTNLVLVMRDGRMADYGPKAEILKKLTVGPTALAAAKDTDAQSGAAAA
jgi:ATP-binding cassette subfamily C protein